MLNKAVNGLVGVYLLIKQVLKEKNDCGDGYVGYEGGGDINLLWKFKL